jgi:hypothetical protein
MDLRHALEESFSNERVLTAVETIEANAPAHVVSGGYRGPAFRFPDLLPNTRTGAEVLSDCADVSTVLELAWIREATVAEHPLAVARNSVGEVVSVCHSARRSGRGAEAGVETAPGYRGRGLAAAVVVAWARALISEGLVPLYSTQWTNTASRAVARKLGLIIYGEDYHD